LWPVRYFVEIAPPTGHKIQYSISVFVTASKEQTCSRRDKDLLVYFTLDRHHFCSLLLTAWVVRTSDWQLEGMNNEALTYSEQHVKEMTPKMKNQRIVVKRK